ncbi:MAG TPA: type VI secretion system accessory protein TagJ [Bryobacteraceae bacterium]|nr:type VI secretion system accessory protein TagJ [Bryobacteraceae bacterium]
MTARELYQAGKLDEAVQALNGELRNHPDDSQRRTFLFELLCFAGNFDRAEKQLDILSQGSPEAMTGGLLYRAVLSADRSRREMFDKKEYPTTGSDVHEPSGTLNGTPFQSISDSDPRIGPRLEVFAAGQYIWIPFEHIASLEMQAPKRLRDLLWAPVIVRTGPSFRGVELGEVLVPVLSPFSFRHADDAVRLGRASVWEEKDGEQIPFGQKSLLVDGEDIPILELRHLEIASREEESPQENASAQ